ncbi:MAG: amidase [Candidatus Tectomicrobia bacterium]|nr:amidase [Candidatus Tectomicrobia bacterium]
MADEAWRLTLSEGLRRLGEGSLTASDWVRSLLERIEGCEGRVRAWVHVDREGALVAARALDGSGAGGRSHPLAGAPVAFKDIIDVQGMPREANSPLYKGYVPQQDASAAARLRAAGAILLGKTVTTQFATSDPPVTRNPWNFVHSPGGSSSGSAAAVAAGMAPAALGSQTGGSVLRPSAFCGVVGFKPTYGRIPRTGMVTVSWTLDHVGTITRSAEDAARLLTVLAGPDGGDDGSLGAAVPDYASASAPRRPGRVCFLKEDFLPRASREVAEWTERAAARMRENGVAVEEGRLPVDFGQLHAAHRIIMRVEAAAYHDRMFRENMDAYLPEIRHNISSGLMVPAVHYVQALRLRARLARETQRLLERYELVVLPSMVEAPPLREKSTGNALFQEPLTQAGLPAITLPLGRGEGNLPVGIQLGAGRLREADLLGAARWCEGELGWRSEIASL